MTGPELTTIKEQLGLNSRALATTLGVHWTTISRWEHGHVPIPQIAAAFLAYLAKAPRQRCAHCDASQI